MPTYTAKPGLYVSDGGLETSHEWQRDGVAIPDETGLSYTTVSPDDDFSEIAFAETAVDTNGSVTNRVVARPQPFPLTIQFRDSHLSMTSSVNATLPFGPSASYTRQMTLALRFSGITSGSDADNHIGIVSVLGVNIENNRFNIANKRLRIRSRRSNFSLLGTELAPTIQDNTPFTLSLLAAIDYDAGLPGGEVFVVWGSLDGGAWARLGGHSTAPADALEKIAPIVDFGAQNATMTGKHFDLSHWLWAHDVALDPATNWQHFFEANGSVKNLGATGEVAGVTPKLYMKGTDFIGSGTTLSNSGSQGEVGRARTPISVVTT